MSFSFLLTYALKTLRADQNHALLTVLLVTVGTGFLAATLALGRGVMDNLTGDIRRAAGGDVVAQAREEPFTKQHLAAFDNLKRRDVIEEYSAQVTLNKAIKSKAGASLAVYWFVDPDTYPLYGSAPKTLDPAGESVVSALRNGVVVSRKVADRLHLKVGHRLTFEAEPGSRPVAAIVGDEVQPSLDVRVLGFVVRPLADLEKTLKYSPQEPGLAAKTVYVRTAPTKVKVAARELRRLSPRYTLVETADTLAAATKPQAETIRQVIGSIGLLTLLITGVGIAFAVRVWSSRRIRETAILKALGLRRRGTAVIFLVTLGLISFLGTVLALPLSWGLSFLLEGAGRQFFGLTQGNYLFYPLEWAAASLAAFLATAAFGIFSLFSLARTSPGVALRVAEGDFPSLPPGMTFLAGLCSLALLTGAAALVLRSAGPALLAAPAAFLLGGLLVLVCASVLAVLARLPLPPGAARLALASLRARGRSAAAISLVILIGMLTLGYVLILAENLKSSISRELARQAGHDAMVVVPSDGAAAARADKILRRSPFLDSVARGEIRPVSLRSISRDRARLRRALDIAAMPGPEGDPFLFDLVKTVTLRDTDTYRPWRRIAKGRDLAPSDHEKRVLILSGRIAAPLGIRIGDSLDFATSTGSLPFEVVGITERSMVSIGDDMIAPTSGFPTGAAVGSVYYLGLRGNHSAAIRDIERRLPTAAVLDISEVTRAFTAVIDGLRVFPLMISLLALVTSAVVVASSVALATLGRRRELATLRALGAKRRRVLWVLTLEHLTLGLVGGLGATAIVWLLTTLSVGTMFKSPAPVAPASFLVLLALAAAVSILAGLLPALRASKQPPAVALRYE